MKLVEIYIDPTVENYTKYLKANGWYKKPKLTGGKYVRVEFTPKFKEKGFSTLADARRDAPTSRNVHWQIFDTNSNNVVAVPPWVTSDSWSTWDRKADSR